MENNDFETILTVKEFDKCCSFYHGLLADAQISISSNFLMKFNLQSGKTLKICAPSPLQSNIAPLPMLLNLNLSENGIKHAIEFLMHHNSKFAAEGNVIRTIDPAGNILLIHGGRDCDLKAVRTDNKTRKIEIP